MSQFISLEDAVSMTTAYRENRDSILKSEYAGTTYLPNAESFESPQLNTLLSLPDCEGLRIYYGMDENSKVHLIIVGIDNNGNDILPQSSTTVGEFIIETGKRCPPDCDNSDSPLNA